MKLKKKLAQKRIAALNPVDREAAWLDGFERAKAMFVDYATRFLDSPELKPGDHHLKIFLAVGEQEF